MTARLPVRPLLTALALGFTLAGATNQAPNLRQFKPSDLCPPAAYVTLDDKEDSDLAAALEEQLDKYATLYGIRYGDPKTCTLDHFLTVDAFEGNDGRYSYVIEMGIELPGEVSATVGGRSVKLKTPKIWSSIYYGSYTDLDALKEGVTDKTRNYYDEFALDWKATHK